MACVLVVCTGNVCRSPIAEALIRSTLEQRFGARAPSVASAGTAGWEGSAASPGSVEAAGELGLDISGHRARRLDPEVVCEATLVLAMATEHRELVGGLVPEAADRAFTLKELVRLLEGLPAPDGESEDPEATLATRAAEAGALRRGGFAVEDDPDEDVDDPLGMPLETYRQVAGELERWCARLADGLFGREPARASAEGA